MPEMENLSRGRVVAVVAVVGLVVPLPAVGAVAGLANPGEPTDTIGPPGSVTDDRSPGRVTVGIEQSRAQQTTPQNNTSVHHRNPDEVSEFGDLFGVRGWLSNRLGDLLGDSALQLDQGEYEAARSILGDRFTDRLDQFVDVTGETFTDDDDDNDDPYRETRESQRNLSETAQEYERNFEDYQEARENGNETAARREARQLNALARRTRQLNRTVVRNYRRIENQTGQSMAEPISHIANVTRNITTRQERIEAALFTGTQLRLVPERTNISFRNPLTARGRLVTADGDPVANRTIALGVGPRRQRVRLNGSGWFAFNYRPRAVRVNRSAIRVAYRPAPESEYLPTNETVNVSIRQVEATLSASVAPETVAYRDSFRVNATLSVDGRPVSGLPVRAFVGDYRLRGNPVTSSGSGAVTESMPAVVAPGRRPVTVAAGNETTAVTARNGSATLVVRETETNLSLAGESVTASEVRLVGRLTTVDGRPAPGQPVSVAATNGTQRTARTGPNGSYAVTLPRDQLDGGSDGRVLVRATFDGTGRNLDDSTAVVRVDVTLPGGNGNDGNGGSDTGSGGGFAGIGSVVPGDGGIDVVGGLVVAALLLVLVVLVVVRRSLSDEEGEGGDTAAATAGDEPGDDADDVGDSDGETGRPAGLDLGPGHSYLQSGDESAALQYTYQHLRGQVAGTFAVGRADTHWEFFNACRDGGMDAARLETLRSLVEAYETVTFHQDPGIDVDVSSLFDSIESQWGPATESSD